MTGMQVTQTNTQITWESIMLRGTRALIIVAASLVIGTAVSCDQAQATEPGWPKGPYKYVVIDQDIRDVLVEFEQNTKVAVSLKMSDAVKGRVRGPLPIVTAEEFLNKTICESHGLVWYFDGKVLYINANSEIESSLIDIGRVRPQELVDSLVELGYADMRYSIQATAAGLVRVTGPPPYLSLLRQTVAAMMRSPPPPPALDKVPDDPRVKVIRGGG
jgi:type II secretory pathway component GspD/PulD (secretin)